MQKTIENPALGVDLSAMDKAVAPQEDFFRYVNGSWLKSAEIPADKARYGAFDKLSDKAEADTKAIIEELVAADQVVDSDGQRIADLYKSFMDETAVEKRGVDPIQADLQAIDALGSKEELVRLFGRSGVLGIGAPLVHWVGPDSKDPSTYITHIHQAGLGLPDRDYYFKDDEATVKIQVKYREYLTTLFTLAGEDAAQEKAQAVYALEKALAEHHWTRVQNRDRDKTYNKIGIADLADGFDWKAYLNEALIRGEETHVIVSQPDYIKGLVEVLAAKPLEDWKVYMKARTLNGFAFYLTKAFVAAKFEYVGKTLSGQPEIRPRWKRATSLVDGSVGELVGKIYVQKHFPESSKKRMVELVENLRAAYAERIEGLAWMGAETKKKALVKLKKFTPKIGYPDKWRDFAKLQVKPDDLIGNIRASNKVDYDYMVEKLGKPVDRGEWHMQPQTVNAYYNPTMNEVVFPAAILQPPFFNPAADDAVNYGAIGGVIGHEMGHGFDDQGAKSDGDGVLENWWADEDKRAFTERTGKLADQYDAYEPLPGVKINGKLTLGENIGDLGGLTVAHHAYRLSLDGANPPEIEGFTGVQRFFLGWGQVWRAKSREEDLRQRINTDPHSPAEYRVNGVVRNMPEFYTAWGVDTRHALFMKESDRVAIW